MSRLLEALHSGRVLLMDGAMGTELQRAGMPEGACYEEWNLTYPDKVLAIHKAYVDVNEKGTEAAAATAAVMTRTSAIVQQKPRAVFRADHPFFYVIRENRTGSMLFLGRLANPA